MDKETISLPSIYRLIIIAATIGYCVFILFYKIDEEPLHRWDEPSYANNAFYLAIDGEIPDYYYNMRGDGIDQEVTKPPFVFFIQAQFLKLLGYTSNLAIRLHSLIAALVLAIFLLNIFVKEFKQFFWGIFSVLVLFSLKGYLYHHVARSGDFDSILLLVLTIANYYFYKTLDVEKGISTKYFYKVAIFIALGILTKSVAALTILPGFAVYALYKKKLKAILLNKALLFAIFIALFPAALYYGIAEIFDPGNFKHVMDHEILGRYTETLHDNAHPFYYYIQNLFVKHYHAPWSIFMILAVVMVYFSNNKRLKEFTFYQIIYVVLYLAVISYSKTKTPWYIAPIYPSIAIIAGSGLYILFTAVSQYLCLEKRKPVKYFAFALVFIFGFFMLPVKKTVSQVLNYKKERHDEGDFYNFYEYPLKYALENDVVGEGDTIVVLRDSLTRYSPQLSYYKNIFSRAYGVALLVDAVQPDKKYTDNYVIISKDKYRDFNNKTDYKNIATFYETFLMKSNY